MNLTLNIKLRELENIIRTCKQTTEHVQFQAEPWQESSTRGTIDYIRSQYLAELTTKVIETIKLIDSEKVYIDMTDLEYRQTICTAENRLTAIPFGSADWQRQYGFIEGLKQVKFYTKTNYAVQN